MRRALTLVFAAWLVGINGGCAVAADLELRWEWPADRKPEHRIAATVASLAPAHEGVKMSPSIAAHVPDPMLLEATVEAGRADWAGRGLTLRLPKLELARIAVGDRVALGLVGDGVCICIAAVPAGQDPAQLEKWLDDWTCTP